MPLSTQELDDLLPPPPTPVGSYVPVIQTGNLVFTSGTLPMKDGKVDCIGQVGGFQVTLVRGQEAARLCVLNALSIIKSHLGSLDRVARVVKLTGFVNSVHTFHQQPAVMNAASDFLVEAFGEKGRHVRSAVGVAALPLNAAVEIELIVEIQ